MPMRLFLLTISHVLATNTSNWKLTKNRSSLSKFREFIQLNGSEYTNFSS